MSFLQCSWWSSHGTTGNIRSARLENNGTWANSLITMFIGDGGVDCYVFASRFVCTYFCSCTSAFVCLPAYFVHAACFMVCCSLFTASESCALCTLLFLRICKPTKCLSSVLLLRSHQNNTHCHCMYILFFYVQVPNSATSLSCYVRVRAMFCSSK